MDNILHTSCPNFFSVLYLHRKAHALCTSYSVSRNWRPVILDGNSYIDSLSNHWSTYAIAHARFRDTEYEVPAHAQPSSGAISPVLCLSERTGEGSSDAVCMRRLAFVNHLSYKCNIHMSWLEWIKKYFFLYRDISLILN